MPTIRDVAKECGLSTATVSNVLNARRDLVRPETRERVLEAVRRLKYRPPASEKAQRAFQSANVGVIMRNAHEHPITDNHFYGQLLDGILGAAGRSRWSATIYIETMWDDAEQGLRNFCDGRCESLLVLAPTIDSHFVQALIDRGTPFVVVDGGNSLSELNAVDVNNVQGARVATEHLIHLGHKRIVHLSGDSDQNSSGERIEGYSAAMRAAGLDEFIEIIPSGFSVWAGEITARELVKRPKDELPTAIFCASDLIAAPLLAAFRDVGIRVPEDVSVVGFDNDFLLDPAGFLTTMEQPLSEIGARAFDIAVRAARDIAHQPERVLVDAKLIVRKSTAPPRRA